MRLKYVKSLLIFILLGNCIIWYRIWRTFAVNQLQHKFQNDLITQVPQKLHRRLSKLVTIVIRQFESWENDLVNTVKLILNSFPAITIIIVCNEFLYPPLGLNFSNDNFKNVHLVYLQPNFNRTFDERNPLNYIHTKFVAFLPDGARLITKQTLQVRSFLFIITILLFCNVNET